MFSGGGRWVSDLISGSVVVSAELEYSSLYPPRARLLKPTGWGHSDTLRAITGAGEPNPENPAY